MSIYQKIHKNNILRLVIFSFVAILVVPFLLNFLETILNIKNQVTLNYYNSVFISIFLFLFFIILNLNIFKEAHYAKGNIFSAFLFILSVIFYFVFLAIFNRQTQIDFAPVFVFFSFVFNFLMYATLFFIIFGTSIYKHNKSKFDSFFIILFLYFAMLVVLRSMWPALSFIVSEAVRLFFLIFTVSVNLVYSSGIPQLSVGKFSILIGEPCSGIESILLFSIFYILIVAFEKKKLNPFSVVILFILGNFMVFLLNILRIISIIFIGQKYPEFAINMFHENIGWLIFVTFFIVFIFLIHDKVAVKKEN